MAGRWLNLKKNIWQDPASEIEFNKSFHELIDEAKIEAREWFRIISDAYEGKEVDLSTFTKGYMYDGCKVGDKMKVFRSVYKKGEKDK